MAEGAKTQKEIEERRLKPVYESIDAGNYKGAVQQIDRIFKKHGQIPAAMALKALSLNRMNKRELCLEILDKMREDVPTDLYTLQSMAYCYKETRKLEEIPLIYAAALKKLPKNEELMSRLFMSYVSNADYQKQKQTALEMHKLFPKSNPYYFWAVMSIVMQIDESNDEQTKSVLIPLAERMAVRYSDKFSSANELKLYISILRLNKKYEEILSYVKVDTESEMKLADEDERFYLETECLTELHRWEEAVGCYKTRCQLVFDDWSAFKGLIHCSLMGHNSTQLLPAAPPTDGKEEVAAADAGVGTACCYTEGTMDYIDQRCQSQLEKKPALARAPFLARIEFILRLNESGNMISRCSELVCMLEEYFDLFGAKKCWFDDMTIFFDRLPEPDKIGLYACIEKLVARKREDPDQDLKQIQREINLLYLARYSGRHDQLSAADKKQLVLELMKSHFQYLKLGDKLYDTDFQYGDPYAIVATHILLDLYNDTGEKSFLLEGLTVAAAVLKHSPKNYLIKLFLLKVQACLGAIDVCTDTYMELEIKHLQAESLCYFIERPTLTLGLHKTYRIVAGNCMILHKSNNRDTNENIELAYKNGNFEKVTDMTRLKNRLVNSYFKKSIELSSLLHSWTDGFSSPKLTELQNNLPSFSSWYDSIRDMDTDKYQDNRDFNVVEDYTPLHRKFSAQDVEETFTAECIWIRVRGALISCIGSLVELSLLHSRLEGNVAPDTKGGAGSDGTSKWEELMSLFERGIHSFEKEIETAIAHPIYAAAATKCDTYLALNKLRSPLLPMLDLLLPPHKNSHTLIKSFRLAQSILHLITGNSQKVGEKDFEILSISLTEILKEITGEECLIGKWERIFLSLEKITTFILTISIINICLVCISTLLTPIKSKKSKKSKQSQKQEGPLNATSFLNNFVSLSLLPICRELEAYLINAIEYYDNIDLDYVLNKVLKVEPDSEPQLTAVTHETRKSPLHHLTSSYTTSLEAIVVTVKSRIKLLEQL